MAGKFIELKEAAEQLGVTPEKLQEMREAGEIHGYKDGASWKFKPTELDRVRRELGESATQRASESASFSGDEEDFASLLDFDDSVEPDIDIENSSILISDESGSAVEESSSTVVGKEELLADESFGDELRLADDAESDQESDVAQLADSGSSSSAADEDYDLKLADSDESSEEPALPDDLDFESDVALALDDDNDLSLSADEDHAVLGESIGSEESEVALGSGDSGIGVASPSDSGLSLESSSEALELPEDEDMISLEDELAGASDDTRQLQQDEEFLLSPSDEVLGDESSDSGSQVIALDDSSAFESDSDLAVEASAEPMLVEEAEGLDVQLEPIESAAAVASGLALAGAEVPEADYSMWNIASLLLVVALLAFSGLLMADIVRNMWSWNGELAATGGMASSIVESLGMK